MDWTDRERQVLRPAGNHCATGLYPVRHHTNGQPSLNESHTNHVDIKPAAH